MEPPGATGTSSLAVGGEPVLRAHALPSQDLLTLSQLKRGNWSAMEDLVHRYQDRLFTTILRMVGHPEDAADLVQETFVQAMQHVWKFEGKSTLYTWLFRIAINLSLSHRGAGKYHQAASLDNMRVEDALNTQAEGLRVQLAQRREADSALDAETRMDHERLLEALAGVDAEMRAIIVLRDVESCDYEQIGQILDIPIGTVKSRLFRARSALRERCLKPARSVKQNVNGDSPKAGEGRQ